MAVLTSSVTIYAILPNNDGSGMFTVMGQILNAGSPVGDFVANYVDAATAASMDLGTAYDVSMTIP